MLSAFVHRLLNKEKQGWANRDRGIKASMSWDMPSEDQPNNVKNSLHTHTDSNFLNDIVMAGMIAYILIFIVYDQFFRLDDQKKKCTSMWCYELWVLAYRSECLPWWWPGFRCFSHRHILCRLRPANSNLEKWGSNYFQNPDCQRLKLTHLHVIWIS